MWYSVKEKYYTDRRLTYFMKKRLLTFATVASLTVFSSIAPAFAQSGSDVIATVGEKSITQEEFYQDLKRTYGNVRLRALILQTVLENSADDAAAVKKEAENEVAEQIEKAGGEEAFKKYLEVQRIGTVEDFTNQVYIRNLLMAAVEKNVDTSDEALKAYYENGYQPLMEAQHILVDTQEEAQAAIDRINNGETFEDVAKELSKDSTASNGGSLGQFASGRMVPEFEEGVKALQNGEVSQTPVKTQFGYHVIKTINNGEKKPFDELKEELKETYLQSKFSDEVTINKVLSDLVKAAKVDIKEADLKDAIKDLLTYEVPATPESTESATSEESSSESAE